MNIIRALISQLYGFAGTLAIAKSRSLNTIRSISFISRPRPWLCRLSAGNVAVQGFQGEVVAGHNVINFTTLYLAYGGLRYAGFGGNLSLGHPGSPNCCQKITCLHQLYSFATILK